jgi:preprotein translocase subunit SecA
MDRMGAQEGEVLTHPLITRSIEQAQKRVELQNFQSRKRLLEYDDVMNQQREVIYNLRSFALEGGEELKGEALKMVEKAVSRRVDTTFADVEDATQWDFSLLRQDLLMHYLLSVPEFDAAELPTSLEQAKEAASVAGRAAFAAKLASLTLETPDGPHSYGEQLLSLVMLNVLDEKWKDHLYDLDQLRAAIHYRSWGQKDPLIEYKQEAYTMFVDLMNDIYHTFAERFLRVQLMFNAPSEGNGNGGYGGNGQGPNGDGSGASRPTRRYNALGILEDIPAEELEDVASAAASLPTGGSPAEPESENGDGTGTEEVMDVGPAEPPKAKAATRPDPVVVGAGRARSLSQAHERPAAPTDWSTVGRNDPCPCGSGKKFKKCHGASL